MLKDEKMTAGRRQKTARLLALGLVVFINCFGFPLYNLNKSWSFLVTAINFSTVLCCAVLAGGFFAALFPARGGVFVLLVTLALTFAGLGCRYLLELGEVSNTYNFTLPNLLLHVGAFVGITWLAWFYAARNKPAGR